MNPDDNYIDSLKRKIRELANKHDEYLSIALDLENSGIPLGRFGGYDRESAKGKRYFKAISKSDKYAEDIYDLEEKLNEAKEREEYSDMDEMLENPYSPNDINGNDFFEHSMGNPKMPVGYYAAKSNKTPVIVREYERRLPNRKKVKSRETYYRRLGTIPIARSVEITHDKKGNEAEKYEIGRGGGPVHPVKHPHAKYTGRNNPEYDGIWLNPSIEQYRHNTRTLLFSGVGLVVFTLVMRIIGKNK